MKAYLIWFGYSLFGALSARMRGEASIPRNCPLGPVLSNSLTYELIFGAYVVLL